MRRSVFALVLPLVLALGAVAHAQTQSADLGLNADAVARGQEGLAAFRAGDWAGAYDHFHQAESLVHSPVFLLFMARARAQEDATSEALDLYARVAAERLATDAPESWRTAVLQAASEAEALRARLEARALEDARQAEASRRQTSPAPDASRPAARRHGISPSSRRNAAIASGAVGAAGLALAVTAGIVALTRFRPIDARCGPHGCDRADKHEYDAVMTWTRLADLGLAVAGAGLGTAAILLWVVPTTQPSATLPVQGGLATELRF